MTQPYLEAHPENPSAIPEKVAAQNVFDVFRASVREQAIGLAFDDTGTQPINPHDRDKKAQDILAKVKNYLAEHVIGLHHLNTEYIEFYLNMPAETTPFNAAVQNVLEEVGESLRVEATTLAIDKAEATSTRISPFVRDDKARKVLSLIIGTLNDITNLHQLNEEYVNFCLELSFDSW